MKLRLFFALALCACRQSHPGVPRTAPPPPVAELLFDHTLQHGWQDFGWSPRQTAPDGGMLEHDLEGYGGWTLVREQPMRAAQAGGIAFDVRAPDGGADFLELRLDLPGTKARHWEKVRVEPRHTRVLDDGRTEVFITMDELNPRKLDFDRVVFFAFKKLPKTWVAFYDVRLTVPGVSEGVVRAASQAQRIAVDCKKRDHVISPLIYGIALYPMWEYRDQHQWALKPTSRRWGGNHTSRYNYQLGEAWNAGMDWYFRNLTYTGKPGWSWETFLQTDSEHGVGSVVTLPMIGHVAKDTSSFSYPAKEFPDQQNVEGETGAGNGRSKDGKFLSPPPPDRTSVPASPEFIAKWVTLMRDKSKALGTTTSYILDNEPNLWDSTHHDIHPLPVGYDELWQRTKDYASAVKAVDPTAQIAGPAEWGWSNYFYSQKDLKAGTTMRPDRRMHGDVPLIPWYLRQVAAYEKQNHVRLVDTLDLHFYPQVEGAGIAEAGDITPGAALRRIRSTRALWDSTYHDESWIDDTVQLIPRMKKWVAEENPGMGVSIGEWNFGAEKHISGGLAVAEALGRFGQFDLTSAYYWAYPSDGSAAYWAFRAYRDFDGKGAAFEKWSLAAQAPAGASAFVSISEDGHRVVAVLLNLDPTLPLTAELALNGCGEPTGRRVFTYVSGSTALTEQPKSEGALTLAPFSINVVESTF